MLVPEAAGVLSALGLVASDERRDRVRSYVVPLDEAGELPREGEADLRYRGQSFELTVPLGGRPRRRASTARTRSATATPTASAPIELVAVRTADVRRGPRARPRARGTRVRVAGPAVARARRRHLLDPPGWVGVRDGC